jgi:hypothetical protein
VIGLLLACRAPEEPPPTDPTTDARPTDSTATADTGASGGHSARPLPPPIGEALAERCPDPTPAPGRPGGELHRVTLDAGAAACNDGSPPVLYVAPATDPDHAGDWVLFLEGGAFCVDHESCAQRWCGEGPYDAAKMSSRWAGETAPAGGVLAARADNAFGTWNRVSFAYCSSDAWTGTRRDQVLAGDPDYRLHFDGDAILSAGLDALAAGVASDDGAVSLPPLVAPGAVVFAGNSASAFGVLQHQDRVAARLGAARFTALADAWTTHPAPGVANVVTQAAVDLATETSWNTTYDPVWGTRVDDSCAAAEAAPWRCLDADHLGRTHLTAPRVVRGDLEDPVVYDIWRGYGVSFDDYRAYVAATLRAEAGPLVSVVGPACGVHVVSESVGFFDVTVRDALAGGRRWSLHDAVVSNGLGAPVVAVDAPGGAGSTCP